mgnify:CR=1 FL=1
MARRRTVPPGGVPLASGRMTEDRGAGAVPGPAAESVRRLLADALAAQRAGAPDQVSLGTS